MPSRAMLHTGKDLFHLEDSGRGIPADHSLIGQTFAQAGYRCFGTGKWHNGRESFARSFDSGEHIFFGGMADHWNVPAYHYDPTGAYDARLPQVPEAFENNHVVFREADHVEAGRHSSDIFSEASVDFIESHQSDSPYFLYLAFMAPHDPRTMPKEFLDMYPPEKIELPESFMGGHPFDNGALHIRDEELEAFPRDPEKIRRHIAEYYAMITHLDACLGRVMDAVEARGELEKTVFVMAGDNGLAVGQHGLMGKQNLYEHSIRVPLIFSGPGVARGKRVDSPVYHHSIYPTLCELSGLRIPESVDSSSLLPHLSNANASGDEEAALFFAYAEYQRAVKRGSWKLIEYRVSGRRRSQLFNLAEDPHELKDLSEQAEQAALIDELHELLANESKKNGDRETSWGRSFWTDER
jgi:arylsulfatase A-like enzyme